MNTRVTGLFLAVAAVASFASCSSDKKVATTTTKPADTTEATTDDSTGSSSADSVGSTGDARADLTASFVSSAAGSGVEVDESCISAVVDQFSDADLAIIGTDVDNLDPSTLSPEGQALAIQAIGCINAETDTGTGASVAVPTGDLTAPQAAVLQALITNFQAQGLTVDEDCLKGVISKADAATLASADPSYIQQLGVQAASCVSK